MTRTLQADPLVPQPDVIAHAADTLRAGGLVAFPTETVYGLGANAFDAAAVRRIFTAKSRPASDPLIVHLAGAGALEAVALDIPPLARTLAAAFWPGPLTLVLRRSGAVPDAVTAGGSTVAVRVPAHPVAAALLRATGLPIAAPSANLFSRPSPTTAAHVQEDLDGRIDLILDGGPASVGVESTVLDLTESPARVLRPGGVTLAQLRRLVPDVVANGRGAGAGPHHSPGQLDTHYAPRVPLTLVAGPSEARRAHVRAAAAAAAGRDARLGVLCWDEEVPALTTPGAVVQALGPEGDQAAAARGLYAALRALDASGVTAILAPALDADDRLGAALADRLRRASSGRVIDVH